MKTMLIRVDGRWTDHLSPCFFASEEFTVEIVRKIAYHLRDNGKSRSEIEEEVSRYIVKDPETQWGVSREFVNRLLDEIRPGPKKQEKLF